MLTSTDMLTPAPRCDTRKLPYVATPSPRSKPVQNRRAEIAS
jgi:hypothetical protein